ncbi:amidase [Nocardioides albertanoniae]|uniref:Amidase n=1 Tax=Nocardioides albertanoniae TaxID=1175486 RepID=A0A543A9R8_9ACTN|nr:amidase [Nocardioides albertanoniae]TQL69354.1 amidase [Nocardioides albertanoniae]
MTAPTRVHTFTDDALADHDAVELARLIRTGELSAAEAEAAAVARMRQVAPALRALAYEAYDAPRRADGDGGLLHGVPTVLKDNTHLRGMPTNHGSDAIRALPAKRDGRYTEQFLSAGVTVLGKSRMPEFGFNASTEFRSAPPTPNPWNTGHSVGASSGGSAALVAAGAVPIAHANDGGGSIRIPAAAAGLVGLKPSRGRHIAGDTTRTLPIDIISEGVVTRTVRDTATFHAALERSWRNPALPPLGLVEGPARRRLRVAMIVESVTDAVVDTQTKAAIERTATLLEEQGHSVEPISIPVDARFGDDFVRYWSMLAFLAGNLGRLTIDPSLDASLLDGLTNGLRRRFTSGGWRATPAALLRLRGATAAYASVFDHHDVILCPVVAGVTPPLGELSPTVPFDELIERLLRHVAFTPLQNVSGAPAISLPMALSEEGLPIGVQLSAAYGDERTLLELAYALEEQSPWPRIQDRIQDQPTG